MNSPVIDSQVFSMLLFFVRLGKGTLHSLAMTDTGTRRAAKRLNAAGYLEINQFNQGAWTGKEYVFGR